MKAPAQNLCAGLIWCGVIGLCVTSHVAFLGLWAAALVVGASLSSSNTPVCHAETQPKPKQPTP